MSVVGLARDVLDFRENKRWCEEFRASHPNCFGCAYELPCAKLTWIGIIMIEVAGRAREQDEAIELTVRIAEARSPQEIDHIMSSASDADWLMADWLMGDEGDEGDDYLL